MTDQLMDARLRAAGEAWRAAVEPASDGSASEPVDVLAASPRRPRRLAWLVSAAVVAAALVAGGVWVFAGNRGSSDATGSAAADPSVLFGATWTESDWETSTPGAPANSDGPYPTITELRFPDAQHVTVTHRCYAESGRLTISGDTLAVTDLVRDRTIKCGAVSDTDAANERWSYHVVDDLLSGRPRWTMKDGALTISDSTTSVTFDGVLPPASLTNIAWRLASDRALIVRFQDGGVSVGAGTCGYASGDAQVSGSTVRFSGVHPRALCPGAPPPQVGGFWRDAVRVSAFLEGDVRWWVSGGVLTLTKGDTTLTFTR